MLVVAFVARTSRVCAQSELDQLEQQHSKALAELASHLEHLAKHVEQVNSEREAKEEQAANAAESSEDLAKQAQALADMRKQLVEIGEELDRIKWLPNQVADQLSSLIKTQESLLASLETPDDAPKPEPVRTGSPAWQAMLHDVTTVKAKCRNLAYFGGDRKPALRSKDRMDGVWPLCMESSQREVLLRRSRPCRALTFGINDDPSFENDIAQILGCKVLAHDPTITGEKLTLHPNVEFVGLGLSGSNVDPPQSRWPVRTLATLNGDGGEIDILKADIEYSEWSFLEEVLATGFLARYVHQLDLEVHFFVHELAGGTSYEQAIGYWHGLLKGIEAAGFLLYDAHRNPWSIRTPFSPNSPDNYCCYEVAYVNTKFFPNITRVF